MKLKKVFMVGAGGTAFHLAEALAMRLLVSAPEAYVNIIDFDKISDSNVTRQYLAEHIGQYKARVLRDRMNSIIAGRVSCILDAWNLESALSCLNRQELAEDEYVMVLGCPDNHATRKEMTLLVREFKGNVIFITAGNGTHTGQVMSFGKVGGRYVGVDLIDMYPEIANPTDQIPIPGGCVEQIASSPQIVEANKMAATLILWTVGSILTEGILPSDMFFSQPLRVDKVFEAQVA